MSSKARRPYLMGKKSLVEFYQAPVRYLKEILGKESEFEKPYLEEDPRKMHLDFPWPDWPPFPDSPFPPIPGEPVPKLSWCGIVCHPPAFGDCDEPAWCYAWVYCTGEHLGSCYPCPWEFGGDVLRYEPDGPNKINVWVDEVKAGENPGSVAYVQAKMTDPCGNVCRTEFEVTCKVCPPDVVVSWDDDNSAETIAQGNGGLATALVYVKDGLGPYSWSVTGTGFSMLHASTDGVSNTLQADATSCGTATITVTDFCGDSVIGYVRGAVGQWDLETADTCVLSGNGTWVWDNPFVKCELISGRGKQVQWTRYIGGGCCWATQALAITNCETFGVGCDDHANCHADPTIECTNCIDPNMTIAPLPAGCNPYLSSPDNWGYRIYCVWSVDYYVWSCA